MSDTAMPFVMLHLGLGSFHRAHQALYLHQLIERGDGRWQLAAANIRPDLADTLAALMAQGGEYTLETIAPDGTRDYTRVRSIREVLPYSDDLAAVVARGADPRTRIVSFTVTEAGYYLDDEHRLDLGFDDIQADLQAAREGRAGHTIYGAVTALLHARMAASAGALTLLNCDNLRHNGDRFRSGLLDFIGRLGDEALLHWTTRHTACPNAMVDRITPRPTPDVAERVKAATGWNDAVPVMGERFIQWVIEDRFIAGRPAWEAVGVQMVASVAPYEEAKIRILNATHSCIAWAGTLAGYTYIHEGTHDRAIRALAHAYVSEDVMPCLLPSPVDLAAYRDVVLDRFGNPAIRDTNQRVAADGFAKIPGFIAPTVRERLERGQSIAAVAMLPALFLAFLQRWHRGELPYVYQDQAMDPTLAHAICDADDPVQALGADAGLWGPLADDPRLQAALHDAAQGVAAWLEARA
jgi:D-arabinitol 4-dehydrogenase